MELNKTIAFYFRQPALESVSIPELQRAISMYPYCAALQFLLLKKQKITLDPGFERQLNTANLYFPNAYLLNSILEEPVIREELNAIPLIERVAEPADKAVETIEADKSDEESKETPEPVSEPLYEPALRTELLSRESPIPIPSLKDISPQTDDLPLFEPYHTIDYFASQGIKLSQELPVNDRLGRQLRSFTDWIKTMKKLPQADLVNKMDEAGMGEKIVAMAAGSVIAREVVTETMAEVLEKQGNISGAIALYNKLSLAHPDKSAYFAARIEHLKKLR